MERFVFVAAIVVASIFALGAIFGKGDGTFSFHFDDDGRMAELVELTAGAVPAQSYEADAIRLRHVAARVVITVEDRPDVEISIENPGAAPTPEISLERGRLTIDGRLSGRIGACREDGVELRGYGFALYEQAPLITIRAPRSLDLNFTGAGRAEIGETEALDLTVNGCAHAVAANVAGDADIDVNGNGQVSIAGVENAVIDLSGSGRVRVDAVRASVESEVNGSGGVSIGAANGRLNLQNRGSGSVVVESGALTEAEIDLFGSGQVRLNAPAERLSVSIFGSGDVDAPVAVGSLDAKIFGSGDVRVQSVSGAVSQEVRGSGAVRIGQ